MSLKNIFHHNSPLRALLPKFILSMSGRLSHGACLVVIRNKIRQSSVHQMGYKIWTSLADAPAFAIGLRNFDVTRFFGNAAGLRKSSSMESTGVTTPKK
jgi:hypothetical protein